MVRSVSSLTLESGFIADSVHPFYNFTIKMFSPHDSESTSLFFFLPANDLHVLPKSILPGLEKFIAICMREQI